MRVSVRLLINKDQMFRQNTINVYFYLFRDFLDNCLFPHFTPLNHVIGCARKKYERTVISFETL